MTTPTYFTVVADFKSVVVDLEADVDPDPQLGPVTAKVTFTPVLANGDVILATNASPRPTVFVPAPIVARIDTDGRLKLRVDPDGDQDSYASTAAFPATGNTAKVYWSIAQQKWYRWTGSLYAETYPYAAVRLLADTALLELSSGLFYRVSFSDVVYNGRPGYISPFVFQAPTSDAVVNLVDVLRQPGSPGIGITKIAPGAVRTQGTQAVFSFAGVDIPDPVDLPPGPVGPAGERGIRGLAFAGLTPAGDGTSVQGLVESEVGGPVPIGDAIPVSIAYNSTVTHGAVASTARPPVGVAVIWIGSVEPTNAINGDVWLDTNGTAPTITTTVLSSLNKDSQTSQTLLGSGTTPLIWSLDSGTLPGGISLSTAGNLYGTPTATGSYDFTVKALNAFGNDTQNFTGSVGSAITPTITLTSLGSITSGVAFSETISYSGSGPITFTVQSGSLPTGLTLGSSTGVISGTPTTPGSYSFTIRATNSVGFDDQAYTGTITGIAPTITLTSLGAIYRAFAVSTTVTATGTPTITYAIQSGSLPAGLSLNASTGAITGTPTTVAAYSFTIRATNSYGTDDQAFSGNVLQSTPVIVETALQSMSLSVAFSQTLTLTTGGPTITWSVQSGSLPTGLSLNSSTGAITGTPTVAGAYSVTIRASNGTVNDDQAFTGSVVQPGIFNVVSASGATGVSTRSTTLTPTAGDTVLLFVHTTNGTTPTATMAGTVMTQVGTTYSYGSVSAGFGSFAQYVSVFKADNVSAGSKTFTATGTAGTVAVNMVAMAYSAGVVNATVSRQSGTGTAISHTVTSSSGKRLVNFIASPNVYTITSYNQTQRSYSAPHIRMLAGDAAGDSSVQFTATQGASGLWASVVVEIGP